ncbi:hypothetical protein KRP22_004258 [Phytophthora ramorum]|nr:hypothetical protein KRP22_13360 [Phytophthora ramorum]
MKPPTDYGSQNEETSFIRRVVAPDRPNPKRRQTKRLAAAGAALVLIGASAGVGYAALRAGQLDATATPAKQQMAASLEVPDFVESMGDPYYPSFEVLDRNGDGIVSYPEYMSDLDEVWAKNKEDIANSDLPEVVKDDLYDQLNEKIASDTTCVKKAMVPTKKRSLTFDKKTIDSLYYMLDVYCFETPIEIPQKYIEMFPTTQAPVATPEPSIPLAQVEVDTPQGPAIVTPVGPVIDDKQVVSITTADGSKSTTIVDVMKTSDGNNELEIPTGPGGETTTVTIPSQSTTTEGSYANGYPSEQQGTGSNQALQVEVDTPQGPAIVTPVGPVIDDKQVVSITTADGSKSTTIVDVMKTSDGNNELEIPTGPGGETTTVTIPSQSTTTEGSYANGYPSEQQGTGSNQALQVEVDTPQGPAIVTPVGPVIDDKQVVSITTADGSKSTTIVDVMKTSDGNNELEIPTGPGGETTTVTIPSQSTTTEGSYANGYPSEQQGTGSNQALQVEVDTPQGPAIVTPVGPVIDDKQVVSITTADGSKSTTIVDVMKTSDGNNELEIPTGPGGETTTVTIPSQSTTTEGSYANGYPSEQQGTGSNQALQVEVDTPQGPAIVTPVGPVIDDKQVVSITTADGSKSTTIVDVMKTSDGNNELEIPTGPGGETTTVTIPSQSTTTEGSYANGYPSEQQGTGSNQALQVEVDTPQGPAIVTPVGPVIDDKQVVSITTADGSKSTTIVDVMKTSDGNNELEIPTGPGGETTTVTIPSQSTTTEGSYANGYPSEQQGTGSNQALQVEVDTPQGPAIVTPVGPVIDDKQVVSITTADGSKSTTIVDVMKTSDGNNELEIPTGPGGETTTVTIPSQSTTTEGSYANGYPSEQQGTGSNQALQVEVDTPQGPAIVTPVGPVIDDKQVVSITTADGSKSTTIVDVMKTSDGNNELEIPTGPGGETTTVTIPSQSTTTEGSYANGYPSEQQGTGSNQALQVEVDTPQGPAIVTPVGPVIDDKQVVSITTADGSKSTTIVDVMKTSDGNNELEIPTGPGGETTTVTIPSQSTTTEGSYANGYPSEQQGTGSNQALQVEVDTPQGPAIVTPVGPVIDDKQVVSITTADGSKSTTIVDVMKTSDGNNELEIPTGPGGETTTVTIPSQSTTTEGSYANGYPSEQQGTGSNQALQVEVDTPQGPAIVTPVGPVIDDKQVVSITTADGSKSTTIVDVMKTSDGNNELEIPTGPGGETTTVTIPSQSTTTEGSYANGYPSEQQGTGSNQALQVEVDTPQGPAIVTPVGPVIDDKQVVSITTADGSKSTTIVDVMKTSDGNNELEIPTGPGGETTTVTIPSQSTTTEGSYANGYPSEQQGTGSNQALQVEVDTPQGPAIVTPVGPVIDDKQVVSITTADGSKSTTIVDVMKTSDGNNELEIPTGPGGETTTVTIPSQSTTTEGSYANGYPSEQQGTGSNQALQVEVDTPQGPAIVTPVGPVIDDKQVVSITTADGSKSTTIVDVMKTSDGNNELEIPTGPGGETTTVTIPSQSTTTEGSYANGYPSEQQGTGSNQALQVEVDTPQGPAIVTPVGPVIDDKQVVSITTADGSKSTTIVDVMKTSDGNNELEIPTGPGGETTTVTIPSQSTTTEGSYANGYPSEQQGTGSNQALQVEVDTPQGPAIVTPVGPVIDDKQVVSITTADGSKSTTIVDVMKTSDGNNELEIPTGPGGETTTVTIPSQSTTTEGSYANGYPSEQQGTGSNQALQVEVDTPQGPAIVTPVGPVIDDKQVVSITTADGSKSTTIVDVMKTSDGNNELEIPTGPGGETTTVTIPSQSTTTEGSYANGYPSEQQGTGSNQALQVEVDTPQGPAIVTPVGPVIDDKQVVSITTADGSKSTTIVDVMKTSDGNNELEIPTGPGGETTTVTIPSQSTTTEGSYADGSQTVPQSSIKLHGELIEWKPMVDFDASEGFAKVIFNGPVSDGQVSVTLLKYFGNNLPETMTLPVAKLRDGSDTVDVPVGPGDLTKTVPVPAWPGNENVLTVPKVEFHTPEGPAVVTPNGPVIDGRQDVTIIKADGSTSTTTVKVIRTSDGKTELEIPTGPEGEATTVTLPSPSISTVHYQAPQVEVDTPQGPVIVTPVGPVIDDKQVVSITTMDGSKSTTIVDVIKTSDGNNELGIPTGPGGETTIVTVPSPSGSRQNGVENGDKDFMTKDDFQLQIGSHFSEKVMALKGQAHDEEAESTKILKQQQELQDCIVQAANKFGFYGVYEQPPHFQNAVDWIDNDCMKH